MLVVGAGGLGSPALMYLAAAGVGTLGVVDDDVVEVSNLQRQVIHGQSTLAMAKVDSARQRIADLRIEGAQPAPKTTLLESHLHLPIEREIIVYCKGGARSEDVARVLSQDNFRVSHLKGGVLAWVSDVEPQLRVY